MSFGQLLEVQPATFEVALEPAQPELKGGAELVLSASGSQNELLRRQVEVPWRGELAFAPLSLDLRLELVSQIFWAAPLHLAELPQELVALTVFPRGEIVFTEARETTKEPLSAPSGPIVVEFASAPVPGEKDKLKKTRLACSLESEVWHCPAPALSLDLRLEREQHVPVYVFGAKVEAGKSLDLGKIRFVRGASISGYVTVEEGEPKGTKVEVRVSGTPSPREGQRHELRKLEAAANERGFFQVEGVAPGGYRVEASRDGLTPAELWPIDVREETETSLPAPLHLSRAAELEIHVSPPVGPLGKPWKLLLVREIPGASGSDQTVEGTTDDQGAVIWRELRPGSYFLQVANPDGEKTGAGDDSIWLSQFFELLPGNQPLYLDIPVIAVEGTFQAGDEPVRGRLIFGGFHGAPHVAIWSDDEGRFAGQLPAAGEWALDAEVNGQLISLKKVNVEPRGGRPARLDIRLADTRFHGKVSHKGKAVEGATLWGHSVEAGRSARFDTETDSEGTFDLKGLDPGTYEVTVSSARLRLGAPKLRFEIREGAEDPAVEIELEAFLRISGQVHASGQPVPLAGFAALLRARQGEDTRKGQSDSAGVFGLMVPESTGEISLVVSAAGFAWQILPLRPSISGQGFGPVLVEVAQNGGTLRLKGAEIPAARLQFGGVEVPIYLLRATLRAAGYYAESGDGEVLENAAPGHYRLCQAAQCVEGVVSPGSSLDLDLEPPTGGGESKTRSQVDPIINRLSAGSCLSLRACLRTRGGLFGDSSQEGRNAGEVREH